LYAGGIIGTVNARAGHTHVRRKLVAGFHAGNHHLRFGAADIDTNPTYISSRESLAQFAPGFPPIFGLE